MINTTDLINEDEITSDQHIFINVSHPFCMICIGVQGSGKSHSMNVVLENCMINCQIPTSLPVTRLNIPLCGLVLHYDQCPTNICEATGLYSLSKRFQKVVNYTNSDLNVSGIKRMIIFVSPTYYTQRKKFYEGSNFEVFPLLFKWSTLDARQLKKLMNLNESDTQLYVSVMLDLLRQYQRNDSVPVFEDFTSHVKKLCNATGQKGPLSQRLRLLESIVLESSLNDNLKEFHISLQDVMDSNVLIVADLTDPMLSSDEANSIFQVLLEQFRNKTMPRNRGKVVVFDEAHKYLTSSSSGSGKDELSAAIVNTVRLMRHEGIRVLISTQSPLALPSELLELVTVTLCHHFQSRDWYTFLSSKIPLPENGFDEIRNLKVGETLAITTKLELSHTNNHNNISIEVLNKPNCIKLQIRPRCTNDYGESRISKSFA